MNAPPRNLLEKTLRNIHGVSDVFLELEPEKPREVDVCIIGLPSAAEAGKAIQQILPAGVVSRTKFDSIPWANVYIHAQHIFTLFPNIESYNRACHELVETHSAPSTHVEDPHAGQVYNAYNDTWSWL